MNLTEAIDALIEFVGDRETIPRAEMEGQFRDLDRRVFVLAFDANLYGAFPQQADLERPLHSDDHRPVQFAGDTRLPGDWEPDAFWPIADAGWRDRLLTLRALAELRTAEPTADATVLKPTLEMAYRAYQSAAGHFDREPTDQKAYDWLKENGLAEYDLPSFDTWQRYVRKARRFYGTPLRTHGPQHHRPLTGSNRILREIRPGVSALDSLGFLFARTGFAAIRFPVGNGVENEAKRSETIGGNGGDPHSQRLSRAVWRRCPYRLGLDQPWRTQGDQRRSRTGEEETAMADHARGSRRIRGSENPRPARAADAPPEANREHR